MKNNIKKILVIFLTITLMSICTYSLADVGSFDRYDSGSSWSSSDWGSSSSSWDWDDDDYSYSSRGSRGSSSSESADLGFLIGFLLGTHPRKNCYNNNFYNTYISI